MGWDLAMFTFIYRHTLHTALQDPGERWRLVGYVAMNVSI
jgi:hypothetical protein